MLERKSEADITFPTPHMVFNISICALRERDELLKKRIKVLHVGDLICALLDDQSLLIIICSTHLHDTECKTFTSVEDAM